MHFNLSRLDQGHVLHNFICAALQGVAAAVCRHEFVLVAANLFTPECFVYYELLLKRLLQDFHPASGRNLRYFFIDIACQFAPWWRR